MSSASDPMVTRSDTELRAPATDTFVEPTVDDRETKPSMLTTEFWMTLGGIAALIVIYNVADDATLDLWRTCLLATIIGVAYIVSRGFAKSGSHHQRWHDRYGSDRY